MKATLPPLFNGHAPINLHYLFWEAVLEFEEWQPHEQEPAVNFEGSPVPISEVFSAMRQCTDIVPVALVGSIIARLTKPWNGHGPLNEMSFSTAARVMGLLSRKRLRTPVAGSAFGAGAATSRSGQIRAN